MFGDLKLSFSSTLSPTAKLKNLALSSKGYKTCFLYWFCESVYYLGGAKLVLEISKVKKAYVQKLTLAFHRHLAMVSYYWMEVDGRKMA
jgi:hypothetical protein